MPLFVICPPAARETAHNNGRGPLPKNIELPYPKRNAILLQFLLNFKSL
jgi:hypothetical protein